MSFVHSSLVVLSASIMCVGHYAMNQVPERIIKKDRQTVNRSGQN